MTRLDKGRAAVLIRGVRLYGEGDAVDVLVEEHHISQIGADLPVDEDLDVIEAAGESGPIERSETLESDQFTRDRLLDSRPVS